MAETYNVYFDESNHIDYKNELSYYGACGIYKKDVDKLTQNIDSIFNELCTKGEIHFTKYKGGIKDFQKYFKVLQILIKNKVHINIVQFNNKDYINLGNKLSLDLKELKQYFYVKLPSRLIYGVVRDENNINNIEIYMDNNDEYETLGVYEKIQNQLNAHLLYRHKEFQVISTKGIDSKKSKFIQATDLMMGIIAFILQKKYEDSSLANIEKSDLLYRTLIEKNQFNEFTDLINVFCWDNSSTVLKQINIKQKLIDFMIYKLSFDHKKIMEMECSLSNIKNYKSLPNKELIKKLKTKLKIKNANISLYSGYIDGLKYGDRNKIIR